MKVDCTPVLAAERVSKSYAGVEVLLSIDFDLVAGEVHALMGENGAGKSTLIKLLSGYERPTAGRILVNGVETVFSGHGGAHDHGIAVVHQEFNLADHLTVAESLFLGREIVRFGMLDRRRMRAHTTAVLESLRAAIDPDALIGALTVAEKQMVEIAKAISRNARIIIMDEPTAVLSAREAASLFEQIARLKMQGTSFVFVSHKLDEVIKIADRVTVLRDGQWVKTAPVSELDAEGIARLMVGRELANLYPAKREPDVDAEIALDVSGLSTGYVRDASFSVRRGEIFGFAGLIGSGRTELMEAISGIGPRFSGQVTVYGTEIARDDVHAANAAGLAYLTKDRKGKGLLLGEGMAVNLTLQSLDRHVRRGYLDTRSEAAAMARAQRRFDIRVRDTSVTAERMSGGNQQKLLMAKVMETGPRVLLIDEPTRGIDVGTKQQIYHFLSSLARDGLAIVVVSSELPEVLGLATRVAVMRQGRIAGILEGDEINELEIMRYATGLKGSVAEPALVRSAS